MLLYHDWDSLQSLKVRMCLAEKGVAHTRKLIELTRFEHLRPGYLAINPQGLVPALVHQGHTVVESSVINEYLDDAHPWPPLRPAGAPERARMRQWTCYQDTIVHPAVRPATFQLMIRPRLATMTRAQIDALVASHPIPDRAHAYREWATGTTDYAAVVAAIAQLRAVIARIDRAATHSRWLAGSTFSLADIALASFVDRIEALEFDFLWDGHPAALRWRAALRDRDSYAAALPPPGTRLPAPDPEIIAAVRSRLVAA